MLRPAPWPRSTLFRESPSIDPAEPTAPTAPTALTELTEPTAAPA